MSTDENDILALSALKIEALNDCELTPQFIALSENRLSASEIQALKSRIRDDKNLEHLFELHSPISEEYQSQIEDNLIDRFFVESTPQDASNYQLDNQLLDNQQSNTHQLNPTEPKSKSDNNKQKNRGKLEKYFLSLNSLLAIFSQPLPRAVAAAALVVSVIFLGWSQNEVSNQELPRYSMLVSGGNTQYRTIEEHPRIKSQDSVNTATPSIIDIYPENSLNIILRPQHSTTDKLQVVVYLLDGGLLKPINTEIDASKTGAFKVAPNFNEDAFSSSLSEEKLVVLVYKNNMKPDEKQLIQLLSQDITSYHTPHWNFLTQLVILRNE